jgi:hypothetical protein
VKSVLLGRNAYPTFYLSDNIPETLKPRTLMRQRVTECRPISGLFNDIASAGLPFNPAG